MIDGVNFQADGGQNEGIFITAGVIGTVIRGLTIINFDEEPRLGVGILDQGIGTRIEGTSIVSASNTGIARGSAAGGETTYADVEIVGKGSGFGISSHGGLLEVRDTEISAVDHGINMTVLVTEPVVIDETWIDAGVMGIVVVAQATDVSITGSTVQGASAIGILAQGSAMFTLTGNRILENDTGLLAFSSSPIDVHGGSIVGNTTGLRALSEVDARANYWGSPRGPSHPNHPPGDGDAITEVGDGSVVFTPWCPQPDRGLCR